jgi:outer membrane protein TolC
MEGNIPMELQQNVVPSTSIEEEIDLALSIDQQPLSNFTLETHPKLVSMQFKIDGLEIDKRLKANRLLPSIDLNYNFLTEEPLDGNTYLSSQYKGGVRFAMPLFLRKERGDLRLAKLKLADANFEYDAVSLQLRNKITAIYNELESFEEQNSMIDEIVVNYNRMLEAEERKFSFGDSSIFLVNAREQKLIESQLKQIEIENKFLDSKARLFNTLALPGENL